VTAGLLWVVANNRKTGPIPTAYVGPTVEAAEASCAGCPLRAGRCYAWHGITFAIFSGQHVRRAAVTPQRFTLGAALRKAPRALAARIGAIGDPTRVAADVLRVSIAILRNAGMAVLAYTHFWRERANAQWSRDLMASCDSLGEADEALARGWRPTVVLDARHEGATFRTPGGALGFVCPAQRRPGVVTCESCRMCDPQHPVWAAGKAQVVGFVEHGNHVEARGKELAGATA
jgi:hypothetical protein